MISLLKYLDVSWEQARGHLRTDLEHIEAAINSHWNSLVGATGRLPFSKIIQATAPEKLLGRRSGSSGDFEEITVGPGLQLVGTMLTLAPGGVTGSLPGSIDSSDGGGEESTSHIPGPQGLQGLTGLSGMPGSDGMDSEDSHIPGPQGSQGIPGERGMAGADGEDGDSNALPIINTHQWNPVVSGITFPAVQNASADVNTLDDYEEGPWTPVLTFATPGDLNVVHSTQQGSYTKMGRLVRADFFVSTSTFTHTTASGQCRLTGLPFTSAATYYNMGQTQVAGISVAAGSGGFLARVDPSVAYVGMLFNIDTGSGATVLAPAHMPTGNTITFLGSVVYDAAS